MAILPSTARSVPPTCTLAFYLLLTCSGGTNHCVVGNRFNSKTKRLEREGVDAGDNDDHRAVVGSSETDYIVVASTHIDPKVDAASDSGLEIDQVRACLARSTELLLKKG